MIDYRNLSVGRKAHSLVLDLYRAATSFPHSERCGLRVQLRRAAVSVASNLAEGAGRDFERELVRFVSIAAGSAREAEHQIGLAGDLGHLSSDVAASLMAKTREVKRALHGLRESGRSALDSPRSSST